MGRLGREPVHLLWLVGLPPITIVPSFIDLTSLDLKLSGDGAVTISCGKMVSIMSTAVTVAG